MVAKKSKTDKVKELEERPKTEVREFITTLSVGLILVVIAFLFVGFGGTEEVAEETLYENTAVESTVDDLASRLGIDESTIMVENVEERTWQDACLGVTRPDELCAQVVTEGYLIELEYQNTEFEYHTDESGGTVRLAQ